MRGPKIPEDARASILDDDVQGWIESLREEGEFSQEEIDYILSRLNTTYAEKAAIDVVEEELRATVNYLEQTYKRRLSPSQKDHLREGIQIRFGLDSKNKK